MGDVIYVDFKRKRRIDPEWMAEQERQFNRMMVDQDTPTPDEYYNTAPSDCE
ncbi:MAG: hypothetical protein ACXABY_12915 [Candidatus Thorarchaeota archaeon]